MRSEGGEVRVRVRVCTHVRAYVHIRMPVHARACMYVHLRSHDPSNPPACGFSRLGEGIDDAAPLPAHMRVHLRGGLRG